MNWQSGVKRWINSCQGFPSVRFCEKSFKTYKLSRLTSTCNLVEAWPQNLVARPARCYFPGLTNDGKFTKYRKLWSDNATNQYYDWLNEEKNRADVTARHVPHALKCISVSNSEEEKRDRNLRYWQCNWSVRQFIVNSLSLLKRF